jgi:hypothetical protein
MNSAAYRPKDQRQALGALESAPIIRRADEPRITGRSGRLPSPQFQVHPGFVHAIEARLSARYHLPRGDFSDSSDFPARRHVG